MTFTCHFQKWRRCRKMRIRKRKEASRINEEKKEEGLLFLLLLLPRHWYLLLLYLPLSLGHLSLPNPNCNPMSNLFFLANPHQLQRTTIRNRLQKRREFCRRLIAHPHQNPRLHPNSNPNPNLHQHPSPTTIDFLLLAMMIAKIERKNSWKSSSMIQPISIE